MYPDLIARTCGYLGVFIALIVMDRPHCDGNMGRA